VRILPLAEQHFPNREAIVPSADLAVSLGVNDRYFWHSFGRGGSWNWRSGMACRFSDGPTKTAGVVHQLNLLRLTVSPITDSGVNLMLYRLSSSAAGRKRIRIFRENRCRTTVLTPVEDLRAWTSDAAFVSAYRDWATDLRTNNDDDDDD
jgi:hypothetical protein